MPAIIAATVAPCKLCGLIARLDRCGHCALCQYELAYQKPYIDWNRFTGQWATKGWKWEKGATC